jgi:hypothetical protein
MKIIIIIILLSFNLNLNHCSDDENKMIGNASNKTIDEVSSGSCTKLNCMKGGQCDKIKMKSSLHTYKTNTKNICDCCYNYESTVVFLQKMDDFVRDNFFELTNSVKKIDRIIDGGKSTNEGLLKKVLKTSFRKMVTPQIVFKKKRPKWERLKQKN